MSQPLPPRPRTSLPALAPWALTAALAACKPSAPPAPPDPLPLTDITGAAGIDFRHESGARGEMLNPETFGPGAGWFDHDGDGLPDLLLVNGNVLRGELDPQAAPVLYRNLGGGRFADVTRQAGLAVPLYGMGFAAADAENDGDQDLLIYGLHRSLFFRNAGSGRFTEATAPAGLAGLRGWIGAATFLDHDRDGFLDLFIGNYVDWSPEREEGADCSFGTGKKKYCPVAVFPPSAPQLFRGRGDGTFVETTEAAGLAGLKGKALGVAVEDYDRDGWPDLFVANDSVPNFLLRNRGDGTFSERGVESGFATGADGAAYAGMGIDTAWLPDGRLVVAIGNFAGEPTTVHVQEGRDYFIERSMELGPGRASLDRVTFGLLLEDLDLDGRRDLVTVNGHVFDVEAITRAPYRQGAQVFLGKEGGRFEEVRPVAPDHFLNRALIGRALAAADFDADGDLDLAVTENQGQAILLRNDLPGPRRFVRLALQGTRSNRDALGAEVELIVERAAGTVRDRRTLKGSASYLAQGERRLTFGLGGDGRPVAAEVAWPSGRRETFREVPVNREVLLVEGTGAESAPARVAAPFYPPENPVAARERGRVSLEAGRLEEAIQALAAALRLDPHDLAAHRLRLIALERAGRRGELEGAVGEAARAFPDAHVLVSHFAIVLREGGHLDLARRFFAEAVGLDPRRPDAWTALGNLAFDARSYAEALAAYRKVLAIDPHAVEALTNTGKVHARRKEFAEAVPWLEKALALRPDSAAALSTLGGVLIESGELDRAEDLLARALKAKAPRETVLTVHGNLGILYLKRRDRARAIECFEKVLALDPADVRAREALEKLRR